MTTATGWRPSQLARLRRIIHRSATTATRRCWHDAWAIGVRVIIRERG